MVLSTLRALYCPQIVWGGDTPAVLQSIQHAKTTELQLV